MNAATCWLEATIVSSLILVTSDSGAGHLEREGRADRVLTVTHRLVTGPIPPGGTPATFFADQQALYEQEGLFCEPFWFAFEHELAERPLGKRIWTGLPDVCREYDRVALWVDPDANAQLLLLQLLDWLGSIPDIAPRLWLKQAESGLGARRPGDWALPARAVEAEDVALARHAWAAFRTPTPEAWAALLNDAGAGRLPGLRPAVLQTLRELPDASGLGATERRLIHLVERESWWDELERLGHDPSDRPLPEKERGPERLLARVLHRGERLPLWCFEAGEALCRLATASVPALAGIDEPAYTLDLHMDGERFRRFRESHVRLTEFGHRLDRGLDDWSRHNRVHRWIGGTRLTNETLWRWDARQNQLLAPS